MVPSEEVDPGDGDADGDGDGDGTGDDPEPQVPIAPRRPLQVYVPRPLTAED